MEFVMRIIGMISGICAVLFIITSSILFIVDGVAVSSGKKQRRNTGFTVMFIISMVIAGISIALAALTFFLATAVMRGM